MIFDKRTYRWRDSGAIKAHHEQLSHGPVRVSYAQKTLLEVALR